MGLVLPVRGLAAFEDDTGHEGPGRGATRIRARRLDPKAEAEEFRLPAEELCLSRLQTVNDALGDPCHVQAPFGGSAPGRRGTTEKENPGTTQHPRPSSIKQNQALRNSRERMSALRN